MISELRGAANLLEPAQALGQRVGESGRLVRFRARRVGQQQPRFQVGEPGGHHQVIGGELEPQFARRLDEGEILVGELEDRNSRQVDLLAARKLKQQVERPLEPVDIDVERRFARATVELEVVALRQRRPTRIASLAMRTTMALAWGRSATLFAPPVHSGSARLTTFINVNNGIAAR